MELIMTFITLEKLLPLKDVGMLTTKRNYMFPINTEIKQCLARGCF